jgi:pyruvate formate lyase activating enzyme
MKGTVFDIQYYAMYDGPGIRTCVFFKGCPLRCQWCHNPESQDIHPEMSYFKERCAACGKCVEACPANALRLTDDGIVRARDVCAVCGACASACPNEAMETIGKELSADEIAEAVCRDRVFYDRSGGGVTISGGEPTMQPEFLLATLRAIKRYGIHTAIETCGFFDGKLIHHLLETADLFLYDIKHTDPVIHRNFTGVSSERALANFSAILSQVGSARITPRIPLIPGFNDDEDSIGQIISYLRDAGYAGPVHLMPYNRMAKTKWGKIGRASAYRDMGLQTEEDLERVISRFAQESFEAVCSR